MELLQAIIYTTRYVLKNGNLDFYYLMALILLVILIKSKNYLKYVKATIVFTLLFAVMEVGSMIFVDTAHAPKEFIITYGKMLLCLILMFGVCEYFKQLNLRKFILCAVGIHAVETLIAVFFVNGILWRLHDETNGFYETRLQLLYMEPSELSMCAAILAILLIYLIMKEGFQYIYVACFAVLGCDMYLSAGMGGVLALGIAIAVVLVYKSIEQAIMKKKYYLLFILLGLAITAAVFVFGTDFPMAQRTRRILSGDMFADSSTTWRLLIPFQSIGPLLLRTRFMGVGFGNFNAESTWHILADAYATINWFPNSFLYFIAEGGIIAGIVLVLGIVYLGYAAFKSKNIGIMLLYIFIMVYQIPGGYFTNPLNWICYGIILSSRQERG